MLGLLFIGVIGIARISSASDGQLVFVIAAWRHGERAPNHHFTVPSNVKFFPFGLKELTERGIERSFKLGRFFRDRYVDGVFMSRTLNNSEVIIQTVERIRCMMTAVSVGQGMYSEPWRPVPLPVPIHAPEEATDFVLALPWKKCLILAKEFEKFCQFPPMESFEGYHEYEGAVYNCSNAGQGTKHLFNVNAFKETESLLAEELAEANLPSWYTNEMREEAKNVYFQVQRFMLGLREYHNPTLIKVQSGLLLDTIISQLQLKWKCILDHSKDCSKMQKLKFKGFSTQDFVLNSLLESLGVRDGAIGSEQNVLYNSAIIFELWNVNGQPQVKVLYKRRHDSSTLMNLSGLVRNCPGHSGSCPLANFVRCCQEYRTTDPMAVCNPPHPPSTPS